MQQKLYLMVVTFLKEKLKKDILVKCCTFSNEMK
jgi:hypothetical protein